MLTLLDIMNSNGNIKKTQLNFKQYKPQLYLFAKTKAFAL